MKIVTTAQMRRIDETTIRERGITAAALMERAGQAVAREATQRFGAESVAVVAGKGNNAGDGYVAARELHRLGVAVTVLALGDPAELKGEARAAYDALPEPVARIIQPAAAALAEELARHELIIDALFGTGLRGPLGDPWRALIETINAARVPILSIDIPSGLSGDGIAGVKPWPCIRAAATVTIGLPKVGMVVDPGVRETGTVVVADIGFPRDLLEDPAITLNLMTMDGARALLPARPPAGHKGTFGKTMILGGGPGMTGAAILAARAALRSGAGLIYSAYPEPLGAIMEGALIEAVKLPLPGEAWFGDSMIGAALEHAAAAQSVAIGLGIGRRPETAAFLRAMIRGVRAPLVIDADGLNLLAENIGDLQHRPGPTILTPHPAEAARLLRCTVEEIERDRLSAFLDFAREHGVVVALKGAQTVVTAPDGQRHLNPTGNSGLAKGGSGDVLTGLLAGLLAQGCDALAAARLGVFLHGVAADAAAEREGLRAMIPGDVIAAFGEAFRRIEERG